VAAPEPGILHALRDNNTRAFRRYGPLSVDGPRLSAVGPPQDVQGAMEVRNAELGLRIAPHPFANSAIISHSLAVAGNVSLKLHNITGRLVSTLARGYPPADSHFYSLASGIYVPRLETDGHSATEKLIIE